MSNSSEDIHVDNTSDPSDANRHSLTENVGRNLPDVVELNSDSDTEPLVKDSEDENESSDATIPDTSNEKKQSITIQNENPNSATTDQHTSGTTSGPAVTASKRSYEVMRYEREDEDQTCSICLEIWTSEGQHRLCSLKCGHLFGKSCIFNWLVKQKKNGCPQCNKKASSFDIRELFASKLVALDCSEKTRLEHEIEIAREEKRQVEIELEKCRLFAENYKQEVRKLQAQLARYTGNSDSNHLLRKTMRFHLEKTFQINDGYCRVCIYNSFNKMLLVCHQNKNQLFPGFGIKKIQNLGSDYIGNNFLHLHSKTIRDIRFHPLNPTLILTVGFDKCAKLCDLEKQSIIQTFTADHPLWSCCWDDDDPNYFYVGNGKGTIHIFDVRSPSEAVKELKLIGDTSSVVSVCYVPNKAQHNGGVLCCRLNSVVFYQKTTSDEFISHRFNTLVGPFFSLIFDRSTSHVVVSCRPSSGVSNVRHIYFLLDGENCQPVHVFIGGTVQSMLSRPCFIKNDNETYLAAFQENSSSIELWSIATGLRVTSFHVREEIFDVTSFSIGERIFLVTVASSFVRFYESS